VDSLGTEEGQVRLDKSIKTDKALEGSYGSGVEKAKYLSSEFFNNLCSRMQNKDFTLFLISQVRENIGSALYAPKFR
ncbi:hypothetical protein, partial [Staphylococcus aureus]